MSESFQQEALAAERTAAIIESNDEEVVRAQEIPAPSNTERDETKNEEQENLTESTDDKVAATQIENIPLQEHKATENSSAKEKTKPYPDPHESFKETKNDADISCVSAKESNNSPQTSSSMQNSDIETCFQIPERHENKDPSESNIKKDFIITPVMIKNIDNDNKVIDKSSVATKAVIDSPLKTSSISKIIDENHDKESIAEKTICKDTITSSTKIEKIDNEDASSLAQETIPNKDLAEMKKSPVQPSSKDEHAEHVTYTDDGSAIYTDPQTKYQYKWCTRENNWIPCDASSSTINPYENEHYKWCSETEQWIPKNTQVTETEHYKWDAEKNEWIAKVNDGTSSELTNPTDVKHEIDKEGQRTYTDKDGTVFFWDVDKNAWFPKIDDDFMARYQMSYGFIDNTSASLREKEELELKTKLLKEQELERLVEEAKANHEASIETKGLKRKAQQEPPKWFDIDPAQNTKVYVTNLPLDITLNEFADVMGKCGMIMRDPQTQKYKLKLYTETDGQVKGDGLCDYIMVESVDLALKILDEYELRGHKIRVQRAKFQMRGEYNPALKPKRKKKDKEKLAKIKEKLFDWRPEKMRGERSKNEKTVIIKNLFHPELFEKEVQLILDYQTDLREECSKCGTVRKVVVYDRHSEGVAQINMSSPEEADLVIQMMQGRFFGKRQLTAEHWDGKMKYKVEETEEDVQKRLNKWDQYLETEENKKTDIENPEPTSNSDLKSDKNKNSDLEKDEQDIEKTINFKSNEPSPSEDQN